MSLKLLPILSPLAMTLASTDGGAHVKIGAPATSISLGLAAVLRGAPTAVNGKSGENITLSASDVGAYTQAETDARSLIASLIFG